MRSPELTALFHDHLQRVVGGDSDPYMVVNGRGHVTRVTVRTRVPLEFRFELDGVWLTDEDFSEIVRDLLVVGTIAPGFIRGPAYVDVQVRPYEVRTPEVSA